MLDVKYDVHFRHSMSSHGNICEKFGCVISDFQQTPPKPKLHVVDIPAGNDLDITEALGAVAFHNATHTFKFAFTGDDVLDRVRKFMAFVHGVTGLYVLSWDNTYTNRGRWQVTDIERITNECIVVTAEVDRAPYRTHDSSVTVDAHPSATYTLEGSARYSNVSITLRQPATVLVDGESLGELSTGTHDIAALLTADTSITVVMDDWWYYLDGTDLIVNPNHYTQSGTDVTFDSDFVVDGTNIRCDKHEQQYAVITFTREDL